MCWFVEEHQLQLLNDTIGKDVIYFRGLNRAIGWNGEKIDFN